MDKRDIETRQLREAATAVLKARGYAIRPIVGRGQPAGVLLELTKDGGCSICVVKTTRDRDIGFVWNNEKGQWGTLASVDFVAVSSVNSKDHPTRIEVYLLEAAVVREAFDVTRQARLMAGHAIEATTVWLSIDRRESTAPSYIGSGIKECALWSEVVDPMHDGADSFIVKAPPLKLSMAEAKPALAAYYGVGPEAVEIIIRG
jgi:hypothetical protein